MNRFQEIKNESEAYMTELLEQKKEKIRKSYSSNERAWKFTFRAVLKECIKQKREDTNQLLITFLRSSILTGSNAFVLAWYDEALYVDPFAPCMDYVPSFLYEGIKEDEEKLKAFLRKKFVQLMEYETEEIRREYRIRLGLAAKEFFALLLPDQEGGNINVWFGEYMKHAEIIGRI